METKLTDFSEFELQTLLVEVVAAVQQEYDYPKLDALILWQTQILNAISTVQLREREISN